MTIKFICSCGKHLRARDEMAARRSICPRCGSPVGIPSLKPTPAGTPAAPLSPLERQRWAKTRPRLAPGDGSTQKTPGENQPPVAPSVRPLDARVVRLLSNRGKRNPELTGRRLEVTWTECLVYPLRAWRLFLSLAFLLTLLSAFTAVALPRLLIEPPNLSTELQIARLAGLAVILVPLIVAIAGLPCCFADRVMTSAMDGEIYYIRWSGQPIQEILVCGSKWVGCFLAGPAVLALVGYAYWINCGDIGWLDGFILAELSLVAAIYWIFTILSVNDQGGPKAPNPLRVADLAYRLGFKGLANVSGMALVILGHAGVLLWGLPQVHAGKVEGWLLLAGGWTSGLYFITFFSRLLGVWCHRSRVAASREA